MSYKRLRKQTKTHSNVGRHLKWFVAKRIKNSRSRVLDEVEYVGEKTEEAPKVANKEEMCEMLV